MKEYTIIGNFYHKNKNYELLLDEEQRYFFLHINNNNEYEYVTLKEYIELVDKFADKEDTKMFLGFKKKDDTKMMKSMPKHPTG